MKIFKRTTALILAFILAFSCFAVESFAAKTIKSVKIVQLPTKTTFYKGTDWDYGYWKFSEGTGNGVFTSRKNVIAFMYNGGYYSRYSDIGMLDMNGLVVEVTYSDGTKEKVSYKETKNGNQISQNICFSPELDFKVGENVIDVYFKENTSAYDTYKIIITDKAAAHGDVNEDMSVNSADALLVLQHCVGIITLTGTKLQKADLNGDKNVNSADALAILRISVGQA